MAKPEKMQVYLWSGTNKKGAKVSGEITSTNTTIARIELRKQGITPLKIRKKPAPLFGGLRRSKIKAADIALFTRQLATMLNAGIPIVQALEILSKGMTNLAFQTLLLEIKNDVQAGNALSQAFGKYPRYFNELYCNLIGAGEQSGSLDNMLGRLATYREKTESLKGKIKKALFYPITVVVIAFLITTGMLLFVVPQFQEIYQGFGADLPYPTLIVLSISDFMQSYWWLIFGVLGGALGGFIYAHKHSPAVAHAVDKMMLRIPIIGKILQKAAIARFARTLSTTFAAGLPLVDALQSVAGATGNYLFSQACLQIRDDVATGQRLQQSLGVSNLFPVMVIQMVAIGEEAGSLEFMLGKVADFYEEQVDNAVDNLSSLLEPMIMVILGVLIGGLVIAMYMPIFKLGGVV